MSTWTTVVVASLACFAIKFLGYLAPSGWLEQPRVRRIADLLTVALLAAMLAVQTVADSGSVVLDARAVAVAVAAVALWRGAPFVAVVLLAAAVAAVLRLLG